MLHQAKQSIDWWTSNDDGDSSFPDTWKLLQRVIDSECESHLDADMFHSVLNQWRKQIVKGKSVGISPKNMMTFMESFLSKGMLNPTENSYNMILHSMTSKQASKTKDAPKWA
jgi:hypothetical protein